MKSPITIISNNAYKHQLDDFSYGLKQGIPIALGYVPVSFTFGVMAVSGGIPIWVAILISLTNLDLCRAIRRHKHIISGEPLLKLP